MFGKKKMAKETWVDWTDFERWAKGNNWLLICKDELSEKESNYHFLLPSGETTHVVKDGDSFVGFIVEDN